MNATCLNCTCRPRHDDNPCEWAQSHNTNTGHVTQTLEQQATIYA